VRFRASGSSDPEFYRRRAASMRSEAVAAGCREGGRAGRRLLAVMVPAPVLAWLGWAAEGGAAAATAVGQPGGPGGYPTASALILPQRAVAARQSGRAAPNASPRSLRARPPGRSAGRPGSAA